MAIEIKSSVYEETCTFPASISYSKRIHAIAENAECICKHCGKVHGDITKEYCSNRCYNISRLENAPSKQQVAIEKSIETGNKKFVGKIEGTDYLVCAICGAKTGDLGSHVKMHDITPAEYKIQYNIEFLKPLSYRENRKGDKNPSYNHGGKYSAWSKDFIHGYDQARHSQKNLKQKELRAKSPEKFKNNIKYWIEKNNGDIDTATAEYKKYQTRNLSYFVEKYGQEEGVKRHTAKTEKWVKSFRKQNFSNISQELFVDIFNNIPEELQRSVYFATHLREDMESYVNKEYILKVENTFIRPDFICLEKNKIIEFDGDYWHSSAKVNPARETLRDTRIKNSGFSVLHVKEHEYKKDKNKVIQECLKFLTQ